MKAESSLTPIHTPYHIKNQRKKLSQLVYVLELLRMISEIEGEKKYENIYQST